MCQHLGVSKSGYYAWQSRGVSQREMANRILVERIREIYQRSDSTYGRPRIQAELRDMGDTSVLPDSCVCMDYGVSAGGEALSSRLSVIGYIILRLI